MTHKVFPWIVMGIVSIGVLFLASTLDRTLGQAVANILAGSLMGLTFMVLGWYSQQVVIQEDLLRIKLFLARNAAITHVFYALAVFLTAIAVSRSVFGMEFNGVDFLPGSAIIVGGLLGLFMYFGLELDAGFQGGSGAEFWTPLLLNSFWLVMVFVFLAAAGGTLFAAALMLVRFGVGFLMYTVAPGNYDLLLEYSTGGLLILNVIVIPIAAIVSASAV